MELSENHHPRKNEFPIFILGMGDIALCDIGRTIPELVYGRLSVDSIRDIWLHHPRILELRLDF